MTSTTHRVNFEAMVTTNQDKDIPLAEALTTIDRTNPVVSFSATRLTDSIVMVRVQFWVANEAEAAAKAREVAENLNHHWPTDSVRIGALGRALRSVSYVNRRTQKEA